MSEYKTQVPRLGERPSTSNNVLKSSPKQQQRQLEQEQHSFEEVCLNSHNDFRALHGSPAMTLNENLTFFADNWAQYLATHNIFEVRRNNRFGENIYFAHNKTIGGQDPVKYWYRGIEEFDFDRPAYNTVIGSFTQVIWKSSLQLGVGVAKKGCNTYVVCNYDPKGNIVNEFDENVLPVGGENEVQTQTAQKFRNSQ